MSNTQFQLGQRVAYSEHLIRRGARPGEFDGPDRLWANSSGPGMPKFPGGEGVIVGQRALSNGKVHYNYEDPATYQRTENFTAYLVAFDMLRKPVVVLPEHLKPMEALR